MMSLSKKNYKGSDHLLVLMYSEAHIGGGILDGNISGLHTNFYVSATLSKKVLIFSLKVHFSTFS